MSKDDGRIFFYAIVGFFAGLFWFYKGFATLKRKRLIENTPTSKVRSIAMGLVEVYGKVVLYNDKSFAGPFSKKKCVYYKYTIEEYRSSGKSSRWVMIKKEDNAAPFYLQDDTGSVFVDARDAEVDIPSDFEWKSGMGNDPPANVMEFLNSKGIKHDSLFGFNKTMRFKEYIIEPDNMLYIMGTAKDNPYIEEGSAQTNEADIMIGKGKNNLYYIADKPEKNVLSKMGSDSMTGIYGGAALSIICLIIILAYLHAL